MIETIGNFELSLFFFFLSSWLKVGGRVLVLGSPVLKEETEEQAVGALMKMGDPRTGI